MAQEESTQKPSIFLEAKNNERTPKEVIDEAWLLWKLDRKNEAETFIKTNLEIYPNNPDLLEISTLVFLGNGKIDEARENLNKLKQMKGTTDKIKNLEGSVLFEEKEYTKALEVFDYLRDKYPANNDYVRTRTDILMKLKMWAEAKKEYEQMMKDGLKNKDIVWNYRMAYKESANQIKTHAEYFHGPQSLRWYKFYQSFRMWPDENMRVTFTAKDDIYERREVEPEPSVHENILGHSIMGEFFFNGDAYNEFYGKVEYEYDKLTTAISYINGKLVTSPIEGLDRMARTDTLSFKTEYLLHERVLLGNILDVNWYNVKSNKNPVTDDKYLGHKVVNDSYINFAVLFDPYLSFNLHYREGNWDKAFGEADQVLDFIVKEQSWSGGVYLEYNLDTIMKVFTSVSRSFDNKREVYTTISNVGCELWMRDNVFVTITYEYNYGADGIFGRGDNQIGVTEITVLF